MVIIKPLANPTFMKLFTSKQILQITHTKRWPICPPFPQVPTQTLRMPTLLHPVADSFKSLCSRSWMCCSTHSLSFSTWSWKAITLEFSCKDILCDIKLKATASHSHGHLP